MARRNYAKNLAIAFDKVLDELRIEVEDIIFELHDFDHQLFNLDSILIVNQLELFK